MFHDRHLSCMGGISTRPGGRGLRKLFGSCYVCPIGRVSFHTGFVEYSICLCVCFVFLFCGGRGRGCLGIRTHTHTNTDTHTNTKKKHTHAHKITCSHNHIYQLHETSLDILLAIILDSKISNIYY